MKKNIKIILPISFFFLLILLIIISAFSRKKIIQPIKYSHKIHVGEVGLECTDCHKYAETLQKASIPNIKICADCHGDGALTKSPEEKKLINYIKKGKRIPWVQIYKVPDHVYFSHRRHTKIGGIKCTTCHGNVPQLTEPAPYQLVKISMQNCINCHTKRKVLNDCINCHF